MKYLNTKPGSIEEVAAKMSKYQNESGYQDMFKKELEKAGKGLGAMTPAEKKAFFNKIDDKYKSKNESVDNPYAVGMAAAMKKTGDKPPLKKSTITKAHDIAKAIKKDETHTYTTQKMNQQQKDAKGEKEIVKLEADQHGDEINKKKTDVRDDKTKGEKEIITKESLVDAVKSVWQMSAEEQEKIRSEAKYMKSDKHKDEKKADTGSDATKVDVEPSVDYKN